MKYFIIVLLIVGCVVAAVLGMKEDKNSPLPKVEDKIVTAPKVKAKKSLVKIEEKIIEKKEKAVAKITPVKKRNKSC